MNFKVSKCDIEDSSPQVFLCPEDCAALGLKIGDRVKVKGNTEWVTLYGSSKSIARPGEVAMPQAFLNICISLSKRATISSSSGCTRGTMSATYSFLGFPSGSIPRTSVDLMR